MKELLVEGGRGTSRILVGASIDDVGAHIDPARTVIITDKTVQGLYGRRFPDCPVITIGSGEKHKTLETVSDIFGRLVELEADRSSFVLGIGGGIVCDIAGFVASTYMRGIRFGFISTTLLAQVDASVGGKNGVNFGGYKNMVGTFNQPDFVICDLSLLTTLPDKERLCGFAEIIKHGAIADGKMLDFIENRRAEALSLDAETIAHLVFRSVQIKAEVVSQDEREKGERRKLNFGHTFGHALEKLTGIPHGQAVGIGMGMAARLSAKKGLLSVSDADRLSGIVHAYGLPIRSPVDGPSMVATMRKDKKREGEHIHFVFLEKLGAATVQTLDFEELASLAGTL